MPSEPGLLESYKRDIAAFVESFSEADSAAKQSLVQLLRSDARTFCAASIRLLGEATDSAGTRFLLYVLTKGRMLTAGLLDPDTCDLKDAIAAVSAMDRMGTHLQPALEMALRSELQSLPTAAGGSRFLRILELLGAIATQNCWPAFQNELMAHPDPAVRSKAALLIGRSTKNVAWISRMLLDKDGRVQANAVEALWDSDPAETRPLLINALRSRHHRVAANAALGLYRHLNPLAVRSLIDLVRQSDPLFQASGLWAIGETEDPRFIPFLLEQFKSSQGKVKLAVTRAVPHTPPRKSMRGRRNPRHLAFRGES